MNADQIKTGVVLIFECKNHWWFSRWPRVVSCIRPNERDQMGSRHVAEGGILKTTHFVLNLDLGGRLCYEREMHPSPLDLTV